MSLLDDIGKAYKPEEEESGNLLERFLRRGAEAARNIGELPSKALLGSDFPVIQSAVGAGEETRPEFGLEPGKTFGEKAVDIVAPGVVEAAITAPGSVASGVGRGAGFIFDSVVDAFLGAAATPEDPFKGALIGSTIGGALGAGARTLTSAERQLAGASYKRQFTQSGRKAAQDATREKLNLTVGELLKARRPIEEPFRVMGDPIALPGAVDENLLAKQIQNAYEKRAWQFKDTKEADKGLRSFFEAGGVTKAERELQDNMIRSLPPEQRLALANRWKSVSDLKVNQMPPVYRDGLRQAILEETAKARDYALRTQTQREEIFTGLSSALQETRGSALMQTTEMTQLREVLSRLDGQTVGSLRESLLGLPTESRARFATLLNGLRCASPCTLVVEELEKPGSWASVIRELRQAAMLSSPNTWLRNILSTVGRIAINPARSAAAGVLDIGRAAAFNVPRERYVGEALAELAGLWNGVKAAAGRKALQSSMPDDLVEFGLRTRAIREFGKRPESALVEKFGERAAGVGKVTQAPFNALNWQDEMMFTMTYSGEMYRNAYREAVKKGLRGRKAFDEVGRILEQQAHTIKDLHKNAFSKAEKAVLAREAKIAAGTAKNPLALDHLAITEWRRMVEEMAPDANRAREMAERAIFIAREGKRLDQVVDALDGLDQKLGGTLSIALPFRRTPANVMRETIRTSPVGLVTPFIEKGGVKQALTGTGAGETLDRLGQAAVGTAAMYGLLAMADVGLIEVEPFGAEKSRADRLTREAAGMGQDSIRVGNWSVPLDRMEPFGTLVLSAARAKELADRGDVEGASGLAETAAWEMVKKSADGAFLESLSQFFEAATSEDNKVRKFMQRLGASFAPTTIRDIRRAFDPTLREVEPGEGYPRASSLVAETAKGFAGAFGVGDRPKLGVFGKERKAGLVLGVRGGDNPIAAELVRIGAPIDIPKLPDNIDSKEIDSSERETFIKSKGQMQEFALKRLMLSPRWASLPDETKRRLANSVVDKVNRRINSRAMALHQRGRKLTMRDLLRGFIQTGA